LNKHIEVMNLYDKDDGFKKYSLTEANRILPQIITVTEESVRLLEMAKNQMESDKAVDEEEAFRNFEDESATILQEWAEKMVEFGVYPKGYFTVDFKSYVPDTLLCWTYGEDTISHTHKTYERFKDRVPIEDADRLGFEQSLN